MAQYDFGTIDPNTKSGTALATDLNSWRNALHSTHGGASAPSYITAGMLWLDTTAANYKLKMYDGAQSIDVAIIDATNNVARVAVDSAATSYITATTAAQIKHVIANVDTMTVRSTGLQFNIASPVIADSNNNELISFTTTASAVNQFNIANAATANGPVLSTIGGDTNINMFLTAKGTGIVYTYSETAATNTIIDVARLEARSSGTPASGIGAGLLFSAETSANNYEIGARIEAVTTDVTAASEDFDLVFKTMAAGAAAAERMRISSTGLTSVSSLALGGTTITATGAELNFVDGVTSGIQGQLDLKAPLASPTFTGQSKFPNGSAAAPAISNAAGDSGVFFGAALVAFSTSGTERARFNSSGALSFASSFGTAGQVLSTNGNSAVPTWIDPPVGWFNHDGSTTISPIYDFAVNGAVATIVSPDFADGYEYQFIFAGLNNSAGTTFELQIELYRETTAAYATASTILTDQAAVTKGELTIFHPRMVMNAHRIEGKLVDAANANSVSVASWPGTIDGYIGHTTAQKLLRARFSMNSGNINAGQLYMLRRADQGVLA